MLDNGGDFLSDSDEQGELDQLSKSLEFVRTVVVPRYYVKKIHVEYR